MPSRGCAGVSAELAYVAGGIISLWGVAHVVPTARVVAGFDTSRDNRLVIAQEWIVEAMAMWFVAAVVVIAATVGGSHPMVTDCVYRASAIMLSSLACLTAVTGARTAVVFFKVCPVLFAASAALLVVASVD